MSRVCIMLMIVLSMSISIVAASPSDWAVAEIELAKEHQLVTSRVMANFQSNITREEFAELAVKLYEALSGKAAEPISQNPFTDTQNSEILKANNLKIIEGVGGGRFAPDETITREQMATMFHRTIRAVDMNLVAGEFVLTFVDAAKVSNWAREAVAYMNGQGLLGGVGNNMVAPLGTATKEQAIALVLRTYQRFSGDEQPLQSVSAVGSAKRISKNDSQAELLARDVTHVQVGGSKIFVGYRQVSANNQDPVVVRFDNGQQAWFKDDYETTGDDGTAYGIVWDGNDNMYVVFSATGTQGSPSEDYRRFTQSGWLSSYGRGGGAKVAVIARVNPENGEAERGTFLYARLSNGNTNSLQLDNITLHSDSVIIDARSWYSPLDVNKDRIDVSGSSPFDYQIIFDWHLENALQASIR